MKFFSLSFIFIVIFSSTITAQNYFQQEVNYTINVTLDDTKHELSGDETFEYINNSPDELSFIYIHLWPNAYKNNNTELAKDLLKRGETAFHFSDKSDKGYIDSLDFKINGKPARWEILKDSIDICKLFLNEPLKKGEKIIVTTPFHVKIPSGKFSRLGHIGQAYQITQWYPKPAVYDKNGWNYMPYIDQGEFYSEFGSFDVSITLPKNYVLGATGDLVDGEKELKWLDKKAEVTKQIEYFNPNDLAFPPSDKATKTLRYKQSNIHDFAWFCDKRYHVLKGGIITPHTKKEVNTWAMFTNDEGNLWKRSIEYLNDALYNYSKWNGDYPYNNCTAVDGTISAGGGMEYPMITVIGESYDAFYLDLVITHEVGHNWFYGILGSNERKHPWLDEGINSYYENRYIESMYKDKKLFEIANRPAGKIFDLSQYKHKKEYELVYLLTAATNEDQAIETPSIEFTDFNYGADVYAKTAIVFDYLLAYLGENDMDNAMAEYYNQWKFKHPQPEDFKASIQKSTGKKLDWFFNDLINSTKKMDYAIKFTYQKRDDSWVLGIKNRGDVNGPIFIQGFKKNGTLAGKIMFDGFPGKEIVSFPPADSIAYFKIDHFENMPEVNRNNNTIRTKGLFKKVEPLKFQFLGSLDNPDKTQLFYTPVAGWNNYNKWMFGLAMHNVTLPQKKFEYVFMPMYSYVSNDLTGYGRMTINLYPKSNIIQHIAIGATANKYAYSRTPLTLNFSKVEPKISIQFKKKKATSPYTHSIQYRNINIFEDLLVYEIVQPTFGPRRVSSSAISTSKVFNDISYTIEKKDVLKPYTVKLNVLQGDNIVKTSVTAKYTFEYKKENKGFYIRFFAGTFVETDPTDAGPYRFRLSGQRGYQDYLYDDIFFGRTETNGVFSSQFTETDGGFKFYSPLGQTSKWITAINLKSSLGNMKLPINFYADFGITEYDGRTDETLLYNAGVSFTIKKDIFEIYFPIFMSQGFTDYKESNQIKYAETIRFTLNLKLLNPFDILKRIEI